MGGALAPNSFQLPALHLVLHVPQRQCREGDGEGKAEGSAAVQPF